MDPVEIRINTKRRSTGESMLRFYDVYNNASLKKNTEGRTLLDITVKEINLVFVRHENESIDPYTFIAKVQSLTKIANFVDRYFHVKSTYIPSIFVRAWDKEFENIDEFTVEVITMCYIQK
ncbi:hypothetical protein MFLAVUS_009605 [Mucor flavus]|uniref:Uncharacterized protein n=1 Tax=Mucor flavus TaxID=439312 RepID=A0ABP9ZAE4_9FUNG